MKASSDLPDFKCSIPLDITVYRWNRRSAYRWWANVTKTEQCIRINLGLTEIKIEWGV